MATISILSYGNPSATTTPSNNNSTVGLKITPINRKCGAIGTPVPSKTTNNNRFNVNNKNVNNNNNNNSDKTTNFNGKLKTSTPNTKPNNKRSYNVMAKKPKTLPLSEANVNIVSTTTTSSPSPATVSVVRSSKLAKTLKRSLPEIDANVLCRASGGKGKLFPLPMAVARRNARERNRVKQVNNGFAALRERIPEEVAEAFEAQGNGRGSVKKLSKVETLRMAVEYIRSLERVLDLEPSACGDNTSQTISDCTLSNESYQLSDTSSILSSTLTPPPSSGSFDDSDCMLPDVTIIDGHQYVRIAGTNTYQLFDDSPTTSMMYENDENIEPAMLESHQHVLLQQHQQLQQQQQQQQLQLSSPPTEYGAHDIDAVHCFSGNSNSNSNVIYNTPIHILTPASISPGTYSGQSLQSPAPNVTHMHDLPMPTPTIVTTPSTLKHRHTPSTFLTTAVIKNECPAMNDGSDSDSALYLSPTSTHTMYDGATVMSAIRIKDDMDDLDEQALSEESMLEAVNWWHSQQTNETDLHNTSS